MLAPKAALAAVGTRGAFRRIDQVARFKPRRLLLGMVLRTFPVESRISIFRSPKMCRFCW
jgi:hypothetical protein